MHKRRRSRSAGHAGQAVRHVMASGGCCIGHCVVLYNSVLLYRILPDADPYGRFPGMPSLRSCIPRLRYLQTSSAGCHIPIFGVYSSSIIGFLRMPLSCVDYLPCMSSLRSYIHGYEFTGFLRKSYSWDIVRWIAIQTRKPIRPKFVNIQHRHPKMQIKKWGKNGVFVFAHSLRPFLLLKRVHQ